MSTTSWTRARSARGRGSGSGWRTGWRRRRRTTCCWSSVETAEDEDELDGAAPYLQFVVWGEAMLRAEVASNSFLDDRYALSADDERLLVEMGWSAPAYDEDGDPVPGEENFHLDTPQREADRVAVMAVRALREVFGCPHPAFLVADGLERASEAPAVEPTPAGGAGRAHLPGRPRPAAVAGRRRARGDVRDVPPSHDEDGDLPINCGQSHGLRAGARRRADGGGVRGHRGRRPRPRPGDDRGRPAQPAVGRPPVRRARRPARDADLAGGVAVLADPAAGRGRPLLPRGGRHRRRGGDAASVVGGSSSRCRPRATPVDDDVHPGLATLLEILHTGRVGPATVAGLFDCDRRELVHQIHWIRAGGRSCGDHAEEWSSTTCAGDCGSSPTRRRLASCGPSGAGVPVGPPAASSRCCPTRRSGRTRSELVGAPELDGWCDRRRSRSEDDAL